MDYLKIKNGTETKQYTLTDNYSKPYLVVNTNQVLPLTTDTTAGLRLNVGISDTTYRLLEYGSASASATYYTTAISSEGLSETTALTCESTSGTAFEYVTIPNWYVSSSYTFGANNTHYEVTYFGQDLVNNQPFPVINTSAADYGLGYGKLSVTMSSTTRDASFRISRYWSTKSSNGQWITSSTTYNRSSSSTILLQYITSANIPDMQQPWPQPYTGSARKYYGTFSSVKTTQSTTYKNDEMSREIYVTNVQKNSSPTMSYNSSYIYCSSSHITATVNSKSSTYTNPYPIYDSKITYTSITFGYGSMSSTMSGTYVTSNTIQQSISSSSTRSLAASTSYRASDSQGFYFSKMPIQSTTSSRSYTNSVQKYSTSSDITFSTSNDTRRDFYTFTIISTSLRGDYITLNTSIECNTAITTTSSSVGMIVEKTRSSTSAYSGVSSSSSESSGWR